MASALRSPVIWILLTCVLVILGISLLFDAQEPDTDWRRPRWTGSESVPGGTSAPGEDLAAVSSAEEQRVLDEYESALKALDWLQVLLRNWRADNDELIELIGRVERGMQVHERVGELAVTSQLAETLGIDFHRDTEKALFKAFTLVKHVRTESGNVRVPVSQSAARAIGAVAPFLDQPTRAQWCKHLIRELHLMEKAPYAVDPLVERAGFTALALIGDLLALEWMSEEFIHNQPRVRRVERSRAAHAAMLLFPRDKVDGPLRYQIVKQMVKTYSGTEVVELRPSSAPLDDAAVALLNRERSGVLAVLRHFAGPTATHRGGKPFTLVHEFRVWLRHHGDVKKAPWRNGK